MHADTQAATRPWWSVPLLTLGGALLLWRFATGVGTWGDEPYAVTTALRYALGDRPLIDSWDTNFSSAVMALPFVKAWLAVVGSADGIMLGYRIVQLAITSLTAWTGYRALTVAGASRTAGATVAALIMVYMPFLSPVVGYGMDCHWHMIAGFLALLQYRRPPAHRWQLLLPGIASMLGAIDNPPTVVVVPLCIVALLLVYRDAGPDRWRPALLYLAGALGVGVAFLGALRLLAGPRMLSMLPFITNPDDHDFSAGGYLARLTGSMSILLLPFVTGAALGIAMRWRRSRDPFVLAAAALALTVPATYALLASGRLILSALPQSLTYAATVTALVAAVVARLRLDRGALLLVLPAAGAGLGWFLGSNAGVQTAMLATPMALCAVMCLPDEASALTQPRGRLRATAFIALAVAVAVPGMLFTPEGATPTMTAVVRHGPFTGMFGTPQEAADQQRMVTTLRSLPDIEGRVLFLERFPLGYLITLDRPATYSTWATSATSERLQEYADHTGNVPERVVLTRYAFDVQDGAFPAEVHLNGFPTAFTRVLADDDFIVYDRIGAIR